MDEKEHTPITKDDAANLINMLSILMQANAKSGGDEFTNMMEFASTETQYNCDVTFMFSMPLLGQMQREPIEVFNIKPQEDALYVVLFLYSTLFC